MKNIVENQDIKTDKPLPMSYEALKADRDAQQKRAERFGLVNVVDAPVVFWFERYQESQHG
ncbi:hypothetical protein [Serratia marcescens]|uniref:hypothetical protein n=1 Tax=Serratia marcescens TaxID=615 RepID=UPI0036D2F441